jgi:hypothetical protein
LQFGYRIILVITSVQTSEKGINAVAMIQYLVCCYRIEVERYCEDVHSLPWLCLWEDKSREPRASTPPSLILMKSSCLGDGNLMF